MKFCQLKNKKGLALRTPQRREGLILVGLSLLLPAQASENESGEELYSQNCQVCHGDDASGAFPGVPDLAANAGWRKYTEQEMVSRMIKGVQNPGGAMAMPPRGGNSDLTEQQLTQAFRYLRDVVLKSE